MKKVSFGGGLMQSPAVALGCMRMAGKTRKEAAEVVATAMECGINFFDHADIYGKGKSEQVFAQAVKDNGIPRDRLLLQGKCAIHDGLYDFSKEHILKSVDGILARLETDYLDTLLLHRPDSLMEPEEVAEAFETLHKAGKVRFFGVSNCNGGQMALLQKYCGQKIAADQLQLSLAFTPMIDSGFNVNMKNDAAVNREAGILEYCRLNDITIQAWSPLQYGFFEGCFIGSEKYPALNRKLNELAEKYGVTAGTIAIAWILRHPADMQAIVGSMNPQRVREFAAAGDVTLTRKEWYELYVSAGNVMP